MIDKLGFCPLTKMYDSCYIIPINEKYNSYKSLTSGFESSDFYVDGFNFEELESTLPELYKSIKKVDDEGRTWYPSVLNDKEKGVVFVTGTSIDDWEWCGIKNIPVPEDEKERFKDPQTGEYLTHKSDPTSMKKFGITGYIDALDYVGFLE